MLTTSKELLLKAKAGRYAIGAFNANNLEIVQAILETAQEEKSPVIIQASQGAIKYAGLDSITAIVKSEAAKVSVPVVLHLDHGHDFDQNAKCLRAGFTSLMFDGSKLALDANITATKKVVDMAHACGIPVEAELGQIGTLGTTDEPGVAIEQMKELMTKPEEAKEFTEKTGIDSLAVAVGTIHGCREEIAKLDIPRIEALRDLTNLPLVLHGASGASDIEVKNAIGAGVCKINIDTRIRQAFTNSMRETLSKNPDEIDPRKVLGPAKQAVKEVVRDRMRAFGSSGKA